MLVQKDYLMLNCWSKHALQNARQPGQNFESISHRKDAESQSLIILMASGL
jgi:hypothetical protein